MANKYFYNGKLVRTSEHIYTHAVLNEKGELVGCRPSYDKAHNIITSKIAEANSFVKEYKSLLKAISEGRKTYEFKVGNRRIIAPVRYTDVNEINGWIDGLYERIATISSWTIVELECR